MTTPSIERDGTHSYSSRWGAICEATPSPQYHAVHEAIGAADIAVPDDQGGELWCRAAVEAFDQHVGEIRGSH